MSDHPYRRQVGDKPIYSPEQTERYNSMWERYQKSLCMRPDSVGENEDGVEVYRFLSSRSPTGDWAVSKEQDSNTGFAFDVFGSLSAVGTDGSNYNFNPPEPQYFDEPNTSFQGTITLREGLSYPVERLLQGEIYTIVRLADPSLYPAITSIKYRFNWNLGIATAGGATTNFQICDDFNCYPNDPSYQVTLPGVGDTYGAASGGLEIFREGSVGTDFSTGLPLLIRANQRVRGFAADDGALIAASQLFEILEVNGEPAENGDGDYKCTCPDFSKKIDGFTSKFSEDSPSCDHDDGGNQDDSGNETIYPSERIERNWENSQAGTKEYCKHILAVKRFRGEPIPKYTDIPVDIRDTNSNTEPLVNDGLPRIEEFDFKPWSNNPVRTRKPRDIKRRRSSW